MVAWQSLRGPCFFSPLILWANLVLRFEASHTLIGVIVSSNDLGNPSKKRWKIEFKQAREDVNGA
jgi:hypothetical protein